MNWFPLAVLVGCILFVAAWYVFNYKPWVKRLWENHEEIPPHTRGEGVPPENDNEWDGDEWTW